MRKRKQVNDSRDITYILYKMEGKETRIRMNVMKQSMNDQKSNLDSGEKKWTGGTFYAYKLIIFYNFLIPFKNKITHNDF